MLFLNPKIRSLKTSATLSINELSNALIQQGKTVYKLGFGQSPFPVPHTMVQQLQMNAHQKDYLPVRGLPELRRIIADKYNRKYNLGYTANDVLIGPGSKELMFILQVAFTGVQLLPNPSWVSYVPQARILGNQEPIWLPTYIDQNYALQPSILEQYTREDQKAPRILVLNYPNNPTGYTFSEQELESIAHVIRSNRLENTLVLSDEIYGELTFDQHNEKHIPHTSIAKYLPEQTIIANGISKWASAGGYRLGFLVFPPSLRWLLDGMAVVCSETFTSASAPIQYASIEAFGSELESYVRLTSLIFEQIGLMFYHKLIHQVHGAKCVKPRGAFYLFPNFDRCNIVQRRQFRSSMELCNALLQETGIAALPGVAFGREPEEMSIRLAYTDFDGVEALRQATAGVPIDRAFVEKYCGRVVTAMNLFADWMNNG